MGLDLVAGDVELLEVCRTSDACSSHPDEYFNENDYTSESF